MGRLTSEPQGTHTSPPPSSGITDVYVPLHCSSWVFCFVFGGVLFLSWSKAQTQGLMFMGQALSTNPSLPALATREFVSQLCYSSNFVGYTGHLHADLRLLPHGAGFEFRHSFSISV